MMGLLYKVLLTINSLIMIVIVFLIKSSTFVLLNWVISVFIYLLTPLMLAGICLKMSGLLSPDDLTGIKEIELINNSYLPSYLGYFFVGLSIPDGNWLALGIVFFILFTFVYSSAQYLYYNPFFTLFNYKYYYVKKTNGLRVLLISKKAIRGNEGISFKHLRRINDFTFIDRGEHK